MKRTTALALLLALACFAPAALTVSADAAPAAVTPQETLPLGTAPAPAMPSPAAAPAGPGSADATPPRGTAPVLFVGAETFDAVCRAEEAGTLGELAEARLFLVAGNCDYEDYYQCQAECVCGDPYDPFDCRKICAAGCCTCLCP
jgi:hypothetical protein